MTTRPFFAFVFLLLPVLALAQQPEVGAQPESTRKSKWYTTRGGDAALVSFSNVSRNGTQLNNVPRFTMFLNSGTNFNRNLSDHVGFFVGYSGKNLGVIYDENDSTRYKRRVLMLGVPAGFKFGNLKKGSFFYFGGQADLALNYKEKTFINGKKVRKDSEWFGDQTPLFMPSVFAGFVSSSHVGLKAQYFPNNFFNTSYEKNGNRPFEGMNANIFFLTLSYDFSPKDLMNSK